MAYDQYGNWVDPEMDPTGNQGGVPTSYTGPAYPGTSPGFGAGTGGQDISGGMTPGYSVTGNYGSVPFANGGTSTLTPDVALGGGGSLGGIMGGPGGVPPLPPSAPNFNWSSPPGFNAPHFNAPDPFAAPNADQVLQDPGYQFRLGQGRQALEQSASGKGILRTGGTLKDILGYGQNLASQEYGNVFNRALTGWQANLGASEATFDRNLQASLAEYQPQLQGWESQMQSQQQQADLENQRLWDAYNNAVNDQYRYAALGNQ